MASEKGDQERQLDVEYLLGIHDFRARSEDELSLLKGDHIKVLETDKDFGDGWYIGENLTTGQTGLFPKVFTTALILPQQQQKREYNNNYTDSGSSNGATTTSDFYIQENNAGSVHDTLTDIDEAISELTNNQQDDLSSEEEVENDDGEYRLNYDNIPSWSPYDVHYYFRSRGYDDEVCSQFIHHKITGSILLELELAYLKEIDITSFGTRFEISKDIKYLNSIVHKKGAVNNTPPPPPPPPITPSVNRLSIINQQPQQSKYYSTRDSSLKSPINENSSNNNNMKNNHQPSGSFDKNWKPPFNHSYSDENTNGSSNSLLSSPAIHDSPTKLRNAQHRKTFSAGSTTSYVEDHRLRQMGSGNHSRQTSYDTVKAEDPFPPLNIDPAAATTTNNNNSTSTSNRQSRISIFGRRRSQTQASNEFDKSHKRRSSLLSALLGTGGDGSTPPSPQQLPPSSPLKQQQRYNDIYSDDEDDYNDEGDDDYDMNNGTNNDDSSNNTEQASSSQHQQQMTPTSHDSPTISIDSTNSSIEEKSSSSKNHNKKSSAPEDVEIPKQKSSSFGRMKTLRQASSQHNLRKPLKKQNTTAFMEGIKKVNPTEAANSASCSGWMHKKGGIGPGAWKSRFFTLHGTRLSYFTSTSENKERGLIDITSHRVLPARENEDKLVSFYAASVGAGRHCFKLVPPAPGTRKGVTFTAPKVHFFAVETKEEMRQWMAALMKATIDRDETKPVLTSCVTPTVPLPKAQELFSDPSKTAEEIINNVSKSEPQSTTNTGNNSSSVLNDVDGNNNNNNNEQKQQHHNHNNFKNIQQDTPVHGLSDSPGSSLRSSNTDSSATNSSSLKAVSNTTSPNDYTAPDHQTRHLTTKTAGLKIATNFDES